MTELVRYQYDPKTGFITGTVSGHWLLPGEVQPSNSKPPLFDPCPNEVVLTGYITATQITEHPDRPHESHFVQVHGGDWCFVLEDGKPKKDESGYFLLTPPSYHDPLPNDVDYLLLAHIRAGNLDAQKDLHPHRVTALNRALNKANARLIDGAPLYPLPKRKYIPHPQSANLEFIIPAG